MFKPINRTKRPITFKDACCIYPSDTDSVNKSLIDTSYSTDTITTLASTDEYVSALKDILTAEMPEGGVLHLDPYTRTTYAGWVNGYMFKNYGDRKLLDDYFKYYSSYENTTDDVNWLLALIFDDIHATVNANIYRWSNLVKSTLLEFNPLWNVDGVTGEIRETTHTGTDTSTHAGTDTTTRDGTDTNVKSGSMDVDYEGEKYNEKIGREITDTDGDDTTTTSRTTTESDDWWGAEKNKTDYGKSSTLTYNGMSDGSPFQEVERFDDRQDSTTYNDVTDERTYDLTDETSYDSSLTKLLNLHDKDLFMQIRQGNIGVTETTTLLTHFRQYVDYKIVDVIAKDIIKSITKGVY
ncbi:MAG: hypothetical protein IKU41_02985 [Clostridia bacterium]|nr:hypothetical protein [Clostridia bacterium]